MHRWLRALFTLTIVGSLAACTSPLGPSGDDCDGESSECESLAGGVTIGSNN